MLFCVVDFHKSNLTDMVPPYWLVIFDDGVRFQNVRKSRKFPPPSLWTAFFCLLAHRFTDCSKRFVIYMLRNQWHNWLCFISVIQSQIVKAFLNRLSKSKISVRDKLLKLAKWLKTFVIDAYKVEWPVDETKRNYMKTTASARFPMLQLLTENKKLKQSLMVLLSHHSCRQLPHQELICRQLAPANQLFFPTCVARGFVFHWIRFEPRGVIFVSLAVTLKHLRNAYKTSTNL